jgi:hypothetical protein
MRHEAFFLSEARPRYLLAGWGWGIEMFEGGIEGGLTELTASRWYVGSASICWNF